MEERVRFIHFYHALKKVPFLSEASKENKTLQRWAFNVVCTRAFVANDGTGDKRIVPMADMVRTQYYFAPLPVLLLLFF